MNIFIKIFDYAMKLDFSIISLYWIYIFLQVVAVIIQTKELQDFKLKRLARDLVYSNIIWFLWQFPLALILPAIIYLEISLHDIMGIMVGLNIIVNFIAWVVLLIYKLIDLILWKKALKDELKEL